VNYERNKRAVYIRDRWRCRHCKTSHNLTPHHIVFQSQGGTDDLDNLITLCMKCHDDVHEGRLELLPYRNEESGWVLVEFKRKAGWK
jgi:5-methylcytosine-specific restriction endonuclease McrA